MLDRVDRAFAAQLVRTGYWRDVLPWLASRGADNYLLSKPSPWLSLPAIRWLRGFVAKTGGRRVFEYGSGGSTLFWLRHGCECVSVEHDMAWSEQVRARPRGSNRLDLRCVPPEPDLAHRFEPADPTLYQSSSPEHRHNQFRRYVEQIDSFPDGYFDLVLIDGRSRPACIAHAIGKVRAGGILVLDNADRPHYLRSTQRFFAPFEQVVLIGALPTLPQMNRTDLYLRGR